MVETLIPVRVHPIRDQTVAAAFATEGLVDKQRRVARLAVNLGPPFIEFKHSDGFVVLETKIDYFPRSFIDIQCSEGAVVHERHEPHAAGFE